MFKVSVLTDGVSFDIKCDDYKFCMGKCVTSEIISRDGHCIKSFLVPQDSVISIYDNNKEEYVYG